MDSVQDIKEKLHIEMQKCEHLPPGTSLLEWYEDPARISDLVVVSAEWILKLQQAIQLQHEQLIKHDVSDVIYTNDPDYGIRENNIYVCQDNPTQNE